jgi:hypothetical protein
MVRWHNMPSLSHDLAFMCTELSSDLVVRGKG